MLAMMLPLLLRALEIADLAAHGQLPLSPVLDFCVLDGMADIFPDRGPNLSFRSHLDLVNPCNQIPTFTPFIPTVLVNTLFRQITWPT